MPIVDLSASSLNLGDYQQYADTGYALYRQANAALGGDKNALATLANAGVTLASSKAGDGLVGSMVRLGTSVGGGFLAGGPIGAVAGLIGDVTAEIAAGQQDETDYYYLSKAESVILARMRVWDQAIQSQPGGINDIYGYPIGWRLYEYVARITPALYQPSYCTAYLWKRDQDLPSCNREIASFQTWPGTPQDLKNLLNDSVTNKDPNIADIVVGRALPPEFFKVDIHHGRYRSGETPEPVGVIYQASGDASHGPRVMVTGAYYLLTLGTIFGMLQANIADTSIVSELMIQRHIWLTEPGRAAELATKTANSDGSWDYKLESSRAHTLDLVNKVTDYMIARAKASRGTNAPAPAPQPAVLKPKPKGKVVNLGQGSLSGIKVVVAAQLPQWVSFYLGQGKPPF